MIPDFPEISPFVPAYAEMLDVYALLREHEPHFSACHARRAVAVNYDVLPGIRGFQRSERSGYSFNVPVSRSVRVFIRRYADSADYMLPLVFLRTAEVYENKVLCSFIHRLPYAVRAHVHRVFDCVKVSYPRIIALQIEERKGRNRPERCPENCGNCHS